MKVRDLKKKLDDCYPESEVIMGVWNNHTETYGCVDYLYDEEYGKMIYDDLYGTPGVVDERLIGAEWRNKMSDKCVYIGSLFPHQHAYGNDDIDEPIRELNGPDGDPDLLWKLNGFEHCYDDSCNEYGEWIYQKNFTDADSNGNFEYEMIVWWLDDDKDYSQPCYKCDLSIRRDVTKPVQMMSLVNPGIETLRNAMRVLKFEKRLMF